ncbi:YitT family protein [Paracoccus limosus]|uniref:YitT family protein n=1 Tax=Paracoccus limosus TaxID=913252 RepID=A0A844H4Y1_9RHOB|nr:YitT family protein [Paracoccus limosus]MTH36049.1 YitT family protein [Paracoccus limosus]
MRLPRLGQSRILDDIQGIFIGLTSAALSLVILNSAGLITGQAAGIARIIAHFSGLSFGSAFFLANLPFYAFGARALGPGFALRSFACVTALSLLVSYLPGLMHFDRLQPGIAAVAFGVLCGLGLLAVVRHGASLGGISMMAVAIQSRWPHLRAGYVQLACDLVIFACASLIMERRAWLWSLLGAVILNLVLAWNHVPGRYNGFVGKARPLGRPAAGGDNRANAQGTDAGPRHGPKDTTP